MTRQPITLALLYVSTLLVTGCQHPPSLSDAQIDDVRVATAEDIARHGQAEDRLARQSFSYVKINDPQTGIVTFSKEDFDKYRLYVRQHESHTALSDSIWSWPVLRVSFSTRQMLIEPEDTDTIYQAYANLNLCSSGKKISSGTVMWNGLFVTGQMARDIKKRLAATHEPQEYEFMVPYLYYTTHAYPVSAVTLMPPPSDLCITLFHLGWPLPSTEGRPLRIDKRSVEAALAPLPRRAALQRGIAGGR